jgi:hypothetical protein
VIGPTFVSFSLRFFTRSIGFDRLLDLVTAGAEPRLAFPPTDIIKAGDNR